MPKPQTRDISPLSLISKFLSIWIVRVKAQVSRTWNEIYARIHKYPSETIRQQARGIRLRAMTTCVSKNEATQDGKALRNPNETLLLSHVRVGQIDRVRQQQGDRSTGITSVLQLVVSFIFLTLRRLLIAHTCFSRPTSALSVIDLFVA